MADGIPLAGIGRRKTSVARVYLRAGTGKWDVNGRTLGDYFPRPSLVQHIQQPFTATDTLGALRREGARRRRRAGGPGRRAAARRRARAGADGRAASPQAARLGLLTRDPRAVERKKPGRPGARKRFQFSKR